ncbi:MAG TPA: hypothetical protein VJH90_03200 [archaeon]|nr:hypothetical protein [archaeon]
MSVFELSEDFLTIIQLILTTIFLLGAFLIFVGYNISVHNDRNFASAVEIANALMGASCIAEGGGEGPIKGLLVESRIKQLGETITCFDYPDPYSVEIDVYNIQNDWKIKEWKFGTAVGKATVDFPVSVIMESGDVLPGLIKVSV